MIKIEKKADKFRYQGRFLHLTFKTWISLERLRQVFDKKIKHGYKIKVAHESADENHEYLHTHCLIVMIKKYDSKNSRCFDVSFLGEVIHPHFKPITTQEQYINTWKYLDKQNCILDEMEGNEFCINGSESMRIVIQKHKTWSDVINDDDINISRVINWARNVYDNKPRVNFSKNVVLRDFQNQILDLLKNQNNRNFLWIYDYIGGNGKSFLTNYMLDTPEIDTFCCNGGKLADIAFAYDNQEFIVFDLQRDIEEFTPYRAIESFKDGRIFSPKYQSSLKRFKSCKVLVLSNFLPKFNKMSRDRYIIKILENEELKEFSSFPWSPLNIRLGTLEEKEKVSKLKTDDGIIFYKNDNYKKES